VTDLREDRVDAGAFQEAADNDRSDSGDSERDDDDDDGGDT
jgi:hypothetical protein